MSDSHTTWYIMITFLLEWSSESKLIVVLLNILVFVGQIKHRKTQVFKDQVYCLDVIQENKFAHRIVVSIYKEQTL